MGLRFGLARLEVELLYNSVMDLILYAIPFFFLLIFLELGYGHIRKRNTYRLNDTINSLSLGSLSRLQSLVILGFSGTLYELITARFQLTQLPDDSVWTWGLCFVLYDLAYYWKHRLGHELALFWGSHIAHHQSEDFNLGTALRQTSVDFYSFLFYLPFFVLGFPAEILFTVISLNLIYQFWVHTEHVPKLGPVEWLFVTPSNHRVHHGRNTTYVDKNYGGVFIIWDRLFASFQEELADQPVIFGLRKPLNSWNPLWANCHVYWRLLKDFVAVPGIANKLKIWFKSPGWRPEGRQSSCKLQRAAADLGKKFDPPVSAFDKAYCFVQFVVTVGISLYTLIAAATLSYAVTVLTVAYLFYSFYVHGLCLEGRKQYPGQEILRLIILAAGAILAGPSLSLLMLALSYCLASGLAIVFLRHATLQVSPTTGS
ncbi:MAG: sterol desaturase family protein [Gammaproteobacteria bacterium]|nr:sterol desaturase family protein [Gammaproteobacteria bacterium]